jgi:Protein of unknown function (DUF4235)
VSLARAIVVFGAQLVAFGAERGRSARAGHACRARARRAANASEVSNGQDHVSAGQPWGWLLAGLIGKKLFGLIWGLIDDQEPPKQNHRRVHFGKLALALVIEAALFSLIRGLFEHGSRHAFAVTGSWRGEEEPEQE